MLSSNVQTQHSVHPSSLYVSQKQLSILADDFDLGQVHQQHGSRLGEETQKASTWVLEEASELYRQGF